MKSITAVGYMFLALVVTVYCTDHDTVDEDRGLVNINGSYYFVSVVPTNFYTSVIACNDINMKLISIQNKEKEDAIAEYLRNNHEGTTFWTSGVRVGDNQFVWSGTGEAFTYTNWYFSEPSNTPDIVCVFLEMSAFEDLPRWWNESCLGDFSYYICEEMSK